MLLKLLPTVFKEIVVDCSIRVTDCSIRVSQSVCPAKGKGRMGEEGRGQLCLTPKMFK